METKGGDGVEERKLKLRDFLLKRSQVVGLGIVVMAVNSALQLAQPYAMKIMVNSPRT
jgi:hypothetical protein